MAAKGKVTFDQEMCKGCGLCIMVCPVKIISFDEEATNLKGYHPATVVDKDKCIGCACCAKMCPDSVITVEKF